MIQLKIFFFGKKNEITTQEKELIRRIGFSCDVSLVALPPSENKDPIFRKKEETQKILEKVSSKDFLICFDETGKKWDSMEFALWTKKTLESHKQLVFLIGGAYGISEEILDRANACISFGSMTWTRNLARLMACEQIYRVFEILSGKNFHK